MIKKNGIQKKVDLDGKLDTPIIVWPELAYSENSWKLVSLRIK